MTEVRLVQAPAEALRKSRLACANGLVTVMVGRAVDGATSGFEPEAIEVFEDIADRVRLAARHGAEGFFFTAGIKAADPFGPEPHVQSATFLAIAAALECGVPVRFLTDGLPAKGFAPLFRRYPDHVAGQIRFVAPAGTALGELEARAASVDARLRGLSRLVEEGGLGESVTARIDPVIPGLNDDAEFLGPLLAGLEATEVQRAVIAPLRFNLIWRERITSLFGDKVLARVARHYIPGRAGKKIAPIPPGERLPLERETSLMWRLKPAFEARGVALDVCTCKDGRKAACGLGVKALPHRKAASNDDQMALWAV